MKNFYFFYFTVNMVMSLSLIDDGDDIFNHMLYSGGIRTSSQISGIVITDCRLITKCMRTIIHIEHLYQIRKQKLQCNGIKILHEKIFKAHHQTSASIDVSRGNIYNIQNFYSCGR